MHNLEKYLKTSTSKIISLEDISVFGINNYLLISKNDINHIPFINNEEKKYIKECDWQYKINRYNFREYWDFESEKKKIGFFGCSFTFGEGIPYEKTFVNIVSNKLKLNPFNFGVGGSSLQRIARTFSAVVKIIKLDYAVFTLPNWKRQMYTNDEGKIINLIPNFPTNIYSNLTEQISQIDEEYFVVQTVSFINWIMDIAENNKIKIIFSSWHPGVNNLCQILYPELTISPFEVIDEKEARDRMHPGEKSQLAHANQIIKHHFFKPHRSFPHLHLT